MEASEKLDHKHILGPLLLIDQTSASIIDSAGLCLDSCFRAVDQCQGQFLEDTKFNGLTKSQIVWGLCGAALDSKKLLPLGISGFFFIQVISHILKMLNWLFFVRDKGFGYLSCLIYILLTDVVVLANCKTLL